MSVNEGAILFFIVLVSENYPVLRSNSRKQKKFIVRFVVSVKLRSGTLARIPRPTEPRRHSKHRRTRFRKLASFPNPSEMRPPDSFVGHFRLAPV